MTPVLVASKSVHASVNVLNFSLKGNVAQATVKESLTILIVDARTKKMITLVDTNVSKDNWIKTPSAWLQTHGQEISDITTVNGKPVPSQ